MKVKLSFPRTVKVEVGKSADVKVQVSEVKPEPSYPDDTFWRYEDASIDPRVFYIEDQMRRHVTGNAWKPMSEEKGVTWADVKPLSEQDWGRFLAAIEEGEPIERWPEENHHTKEVYKIAYTTPFKSGMITDCVQNLKFNVIHCAGTLKMEPDDVWNFCERCRVAGAKAFPRVDHTSYLEDVIRRIKDHPNILAVNQGDEMEGEQISLDRQYRYYETVKTIAPNIQVFRNWNGSSEGKSWDEFFPPHGRIKDSCDAVLHCVFPYPGVPGQYTMELERQRAMPYLDPDTPYFPIMQGFFGEGFTEPDMQEQWNYWVQWCNSYAIWHYHPDSHLVTGFEDSPLREKVTKLNEEVKEYQFVDYISMMRKVKKPNKGVK